MALRGHLFSKFDEARLITKDLQNHLNPLNNPYNNRIVNNIIHLVEYHSFRVCVSSNIEKINKEIEEFKNFDSRYKITYRLHEYLYFLSISKKCVKRELTTCFIFILDDSNELSKDLDNYKNKIVFDTDNSLLLLLT